MSSILTNTSSMIALQTLKGVNMNLEKTQSEISTGKSVASARDNSAVWAISKVMESDVKGFMAISESLSLGQSTLAVAANASETVTDLLTDIKGKIVASQEENVDRTKIQEDIDALRNQIGSVVGAAQFNGLNLLSGSADVNILSSLDRASDGTVTSADINVQRQDLSAAAGVYGTGTGNAGNITAADGANSLAGVAGNQFSSAGNTMTLDVASVSNAAAETFDLQVGGITGTFTSAATGADNDSVAAGLAGALATALNDAGITDITVAVGSGATSDQITITSTRAFEDVEVNFTSTGAGTLDVNGATSPGSSFTGETISARASTVTFSTTGQVAEGDSYRVSFNGSNFDYTAGRGETFEDVARGLKTAIDNVESQRSTVRFTTAVTQDDSTGAWILQIDNNGADVALTATGADTGTGTATGGLFGLDGINVATTEGATAALSNIETMIDNSIDAAAAFGSAQGRIDTQAEFISNLTDSLKAGIGSLVDADMEAASAQLQALQVQQQLAIQSLSIANQAPQSILSLFR